MSEDFVNEQTRTVGNWGSILMHLERRQSGASAMPGDKWEAGRCMLSSTFVTGQGSLPNLLAHWHLQSVLRESTLPPLDEERPWTGNQRLLAPLSTTRGPRLQDSFPSPGSVLACRTRTLVGMAEPQDAGSRWDIITLTRVSRRPTAKDWRAHL